MSLETVDGFNKNIEDKIPLKLFRMLEILQNLKDEASFKEEFGRWKKDFGDVRVMWDDFNVFDGWAETLKKGKKELVKKALEVFKQHFNNL